MTSQITRRRFLATGYLTDVITDLSIAWLKQRARDKPEMQPVVERLRAELARQRKMYGDIT